MTLESLNAMSCARNKRKSRDYTSTHDARGMFYGPSCPLLGTQAGFSRGKLLPRSRRGSVFIDDILQLYTLHSTSV